MEDDLAKVKREFELNYKSFLENKLLFQALSEITQPNAQTAPSFQTSLGKKVEENFLTSLLNAGSQLSVEQKSLIKEVKLDNECKSYVLKKIETNFKNRLDEINEYLLFSENLINPAGSLNENSLILNPNQTLLKINNLLEYIEKSRLDAAKLTNEISLKQESLFTQSIETIGFLHKILKELKLEFYCLKNQIECENEISDCDMLLGKIQTVNDKLKLDLYDSQSLKTLERINDQIELESVKATEEQTRALNLLNSYLSLGDGFKLLLNEYAVLKEQLDRKKWQISQFE